jgi:mRNA interferase RelE/StbE
VYNLEIVRSAQKDIKRLDRSVRVRVIAAIELLVADPYRQGARQLANGIFRYRVGHYRIIYNIDNDTVTVKIVRVRHRSEVYKEKK